MTSSCTPGIVYPVFTFITYTHAPTVTGKYERWNKMLSVMYQEILIISTYLHIESNQFQFKNLHFYLLQYMLANSQLITY